MNEKIGSIYIAYKAGTNRYCVMMSKKCKEGV